VFFGKSDFYRVAKYKKTGVSNVDCKAPKLNEFIPLKYCKGNKTVPGKVATTHTEDGHKQDT
jgi:hypothetical protein